MILPGGGARGAWQSGALVRLLGAGMRFERVFGFSVGALSGYLYWLGRQGELKERWGRIREIQPLKLSPRLGPFSLLSDAALRRFLDSLEPTGEDRGRPEFTVASLRLEDRQPVYATAGRSAPADFREHLVASCAIPKVFPPVRREADGRTETLVDGGVTGKVPLDLGRLAGCEEVVVLDMLRPEELERRPLLPWRRWELACIEALDQTLKGGLAGLSGPRLRVLGPSRILPPLLDFHPARCLESFAQGDRDAELLLRVVEKPARLQGYPGK